MNKQDIDNIVAACRGNGQPKAEPCSQEQFDACINGITDGIVRVSKSAQEIKGFPRAKS